MNNTFLENLVAVVKKRPKQERNLYKDLDAAIKMFDDPKDVLFYMVFIDGLKSALLINRHDDEAWNHWLKIAETKMLHTLSQFVSIIKNNDGSFEKINEFGSKELKEMFEKHITLMCNINATLSERMSELIGFKVETDVFGSVN